MINRIAILAILALLALGLVGCSNPVSGTQSPVDPEASYTVTYFDNSATSGSVPTDGNSYRAAATVTVADNTGSLAKTGQLFTGWNTKADGSGTNYAVGNSFAMGNGNVTLFAVWVSSDTFTINGTAVSAGSIPLAGALIIPPGITEIESDAFFEYTRLTSVAIPNSVTRIGEAAFAGCTGLTDVAIPTSVTSIGTSAFDSCTGLTNVIIPGSVTDIGSYAFAGSGLTSVTISNGVTTIDESAFEACTRLTSVAIPASVTSIGSNAFWMCVSLSTVTIGRSFVSQGSITVLQGNVFRKCADNLKIKVPKDSLSQYLADFTWFIYKQEITGY